MAQQHYTIIVKKHPSGYFYVPFDDDPNAVEHRKMMIGHLVEEGHHVEHRDTPELGVHVVLHSGPLTQK